MPTSPPVSLGARLKALRTQYGVRRGKRLTQLELAEQIGVSRDTVIGWERDLHRPFADSVQKLADFFGIDPDYLQREEPSQGPSDDAAAGGESAVQDSASKPQFPFREVGERIAAFRHQYRAGEGKWLSQQELARRLGVHVRTVESWERGRSMPTEPLLSQLTGELKITVSDLFENAPTPEEIRIADPAGEESLSERDRRRNHDGGDQPLLNPRASWTRVTLTFHREVMAQFDDWRDFQSFEHASDWNRSRTLNALLVGFLRSGVRRSQFRSPREMAEWVTERLKMGAEDERKLT